MFTFGVGVLRTLVDRPSNLPGAEAEDPSSPKSASNPSHRLESWKEIAGYLKREVRTVQRWEKREGLPVHRHQHDERATVYAYKAELDAWWQNGRSRLEGENGKEKRPGEGRSAAPNGQDSHLRRHWRLWLAAAAVALTVSAATIYLLKFRRSLQLPLGPEDSIVIANFENRTGDSIFDGTLRRGLAAQLDQSPFLHIVSDPRIARELRLMSRPVGTPLTPDLARQVCERMGGVAVLDGSIAKIGSAYSLVLDAANCSTGASLARSESVARDKDHVLGSLDTVATSMRSKLGESLASIRNFNKPLRDVTTSSLEALRAYTLGWQANLDVDPSSAIPLFQRAIFLDPNFAMAYAELATACPLDKADLAVESMKKAYALRERVSERERFYISSHYNLFVTGDVVEADKINQLWAQAYPRDPFALGNVSATARNLGKFDRALAAWRRAGKLIGGASTVGDEGFGFIYLFLGRFDKVAATLRHAKAQGFHSPDFHFLAGALAFLRGDTAEMARQAAWASGRPGIADLFLNFQSETTAYAGRLSQANDQTLRAMALARRSEKKEIAADYQAQAALREAFVGGAGEARRQAMAALRISSGRDAEAGAALALALIGGVTQARKLARDVEKRFPLDTNAQFNYLPAIRAAIALDKNAPAQAIVDLQVASPYELGWTSAYVLLPAYVPLDTLLPVYMRGLAYLSAHQGPQAAAEFQKILDHPGIALNQIIVPLSHLGLARARALSGDKAGARKAYQDFFALWQHADPDIPILQQAKKEYARLR